MWPSEFYWKWQPEPAMTRSNRGQQLSQGFNPVQFKTDIKKKRCPFICAELLNRLFFSSCKNNYFVLKDVDHSVTNPTEQALNEPLS